MTSHSVQLLVTLIALPFVSAASHAADTSPVAPSSQPSATIAPAKTASLAADRDDIRQTLATATEACLTKGGFDDLIERFSAADRSRIGAFAEKKFDDLDGRIAQFQKDWKAKYGQDFRFSRQRNEVLNDSF